VFGPFLLEQLDHLLPCTDQLIVDFLEGLAPHQIVLSQLGTLLSTLQSKKVNSYLIEVLELVGDETHVSRVQIDEVLLNGKDVVALDDQG
jgi:hypothetical protein